SVWQPVQSAAFNSNSPRWSDASSAAWADDAPINRRAAARARSRLIGGPRCGRYRRRPHASRRVPGVVRSGGARKRIGRLRELLAIGSVARPTAILAGRGQLGTHCLLVAALDRFRQLLLLHLELGRYLLELVPLGPDRRLGAGLAGELIHARARREEADDLRIERDQIVDLGQRSRLVALAFHVLLHRLQI